MKIPCNLEVGSSKRMHFQTAANNISRNIINLSCLKGVYHIQYLFAFGWHRGGVFAEGDAGSGSIPTLDFRHN